MKMMNEKKRGAVIGTTPRVSMTPSLAARQDGATILPSE